MSTTGQLGTRPWMIDGGLARDLTAVIGWSPDAGPDDLAARVPEVVACGSTAKLAAMAAGEVPPGSEVDDLARRILGVCTDRRSAPPGRAETPSWSCWVTATVFAALVDAADVGPVSVAALRRTDERSPVVDFHAVVLVGERDAGADAGWLCDPFFGVALRLPAHEGEVRSDGSATARARTSVGPDGRPTYEISMGHWERTPTYRMTATALDRDDVRSFCAISAIHSGVAFRPTARLHVDGAIVDAFVRNDGVAVVDRWHPSEPRRTAEHAEWSEAVDDFASHTGLRIT